MKITRQKSLISRCVTLALCSFLLTACLSSNDNPEPEDPNAKVTAPLVNNLIDGALINSKNLDISGTGLKGNKIKIIGEDGKELIEPVIVDADGNWSTTLKELSDGEYTFKIVATDQAGAKSVDTSFYTVTVDITPPLKPAIAEDLLASLQGQLQPELTGKADAGSKIEILMNGQLLGEATANDNGDWTIKISTSLPEGSNSLTIIATDPAGNKSESDNIINIAIDTIAPNKPEFSTAQNTIFNTSSPTITGTAESGATVTLFKNNIAVASKALANNTWEIKLTGLNEGNQTYIAKAEDSAGNTSESSTELTITVDTIAPGKPEIIPIASPTNNSKPSISGTAEANSNIEIFIGAELKGTTTAENTGAWTLLHEDILADGTHLITAKATDNASNTSFSSDMVEIIIDTTPPQKPSKPNLTTNANVSTLDDKLTISWDADVTDTSGIDYYNIQIVDAANPETPIFESNIGNTLEYAYVPDEVERQFAARIQSVDLAGNESDWSDISDEGVINAKLSLTNIKNLMGEYPQQGQWSSPLTVTSTKTDLQGNIYVSGHFSGKLTLDPSGETPSEDASVSEDGFIVKLDPQGNYIKAWVARSNDTNPQFFVHTKDIAIDAEGNIFAVGHFSGAAKFDDLDIERETNRWAFKNIFITKLNSDLKWQWTKQLKGNGYDTAHGVDIDENGNLYFVGSMSSTDIVFEKENTEGNLPIIRRSGSNLNEGSDILVAKFNTINEKFSWIETFGFYMSAENNQWKPGVEQKSTAVGHDIIFNTNEQGSTVTLTGSFRDTILFDGNWCNNPSCFYSNDELGSPKDSIIAAQLDATNGDYSWGRRIDAWGTGDGFAGGTWGNIDGKALSWLTTDSSNNIYITSSFAGSASFKIERDQFDDTFDDFGSSNNDSNDIFVTKLSASGEYDWTKTFGGNGDDRSEGIIYDANEVDGHIHLIGSFAGKVDFDPSANEDSRTASGASSAFIASWNPGNGAHRWVNTFNSTSGEAVAGRALTTAGDRLIAAGNLTGIADFDPNNGVSNAGVAGAYSLFISDFKQITQPPLVDN